MDSYVISEQNIAHYFLVLMFSLKKNHVIIISIKIPFPVSRFVLAICIPV